MRCNRIFDTKVLVATSGEAIHLATGETFLAAQIDGWLTGQGLRTRRINDPYAAAAELARTQRVEPVLLWIGTDWLAMNEYCLVSCVRQRWSRVPIILYGAYADEIDGALARPLWRLATTDRIEQFLKSPPAELELLMQRSIVDGAPTPEPVGTASATETQLISLVRGDRAESVSDTPCTTFDDAPADSLRSARVALSPGELATLLGERESHGA